MGPLIEAYDAIGVALIFGYLVINYIVVVPQLQKHKKANAFSWLTNIRQDKDLELYKEICLQEKKNLFWYHLLWWMQRTLIFFIIGWLVLLALSVF